MTKRKEKPKSEKIRLAEVLSLAYWEAWNRFNWAGEADEEEMRRRTPELDPLQWRDMASVLLEMGLRPPDQPEPKKAKKAVKKPVKKKAAEEDADMPQDMWEWAEEQEG